MFSHQLAVAPMLDWTHRHCRYFHRLLAPHAVLYTEMITCNALLFGRRIDLLKFDTSEHPVALQLGGCDAKGLAECAKLAEDHGYDEINLNVGCPSDRVQSGRFGACLMAEPALVADCVAAMKAMVNIPVTVKSRIGIDDKDSYELLAHFIATVASAGCNTFIIHARKAWLSGLSPKENREIPPLRYDIVRQIKLDFTKLEIIINGGITSVAQVLEHLKTVDGVMLGRAAYHNPYLLAEVSQRMLTAPSSLPSRDAIFEAYLPYVERELKAGVKLSVLMQPLLGLFQGQPGARLWRRYLSEHGHQPKAGMEVMKVAKELLSSQPTK